MKRIANLFLLAFLLAAPAGAQPLRQGSVKDAVGFDGQVVRSVQSSRIGASTPASGKTAFATGDRIGIFAAAAPSGVAAENIPFGSSMFMYNLPVTCQSGGWSYDNPKLWPSSQELSVYGYYPYDAALVATGSNGDTKGSPVITYTTPASKAAQHDLLYVARYGLTASASAIALPFKHAMAQVRVLVKLDGAAVGKDIVLESVCLLSVPTDRGRLNLGTGVWTPDPSTASTGVEYTAAGLPQVSVPQDGLTYLDALGAENPGFFFIPQDCRNTLVRVWYLLKGETTPRSSLTTIPAGVWEAGKIYNYHIKISDLEL